MVSVIICSKRPTTDEVLERNISDTIGTDFEIVHVDNSQGAYSIFEAYNLGVQLARGEYLCLMHEDVVMHTQGWGRIVENYLSQDFVGALGVAGCNIVHNRVDWRFMGCEYFHLIQGTFSVEQQPGYYWSSVPSPDLDMPLCQVATLDGVWICMRRELFTTHQVRFDDKTYHGFHLYDTDICMQVNTIGKGVFLTCDILLEHRSTGLFTQEYKDNLALFFEKWKDHLPIARGRYYDQQDWDLLEQRASEGLEERLARDTMIADLRKKLAQGSSMDESVFTAAEKQVMDKTSFDYRRSCLKDEEMSSSDVWKLITDYRRQPYSTKFLKLVMKFVWYRVLRSGKQKSLVR